MPRSYGNVSQISLKSRGLLTVTRKLPSVPFGVVTCNLTLHLFIFQQPFLKKLHTVSCSCTDHAIYTLYFY